MGNRFWIAFGDIHERIDLVDGIEDLDRASAVLLSGDLTNLGTRDGVAHILQKIAARNSRILAQIGNMDTTVV